MIGSDPRVYTDPYPQAKGGDLVVIADINVDAARSVADALDGRQDVVCGLFCAHHLQQLQNVHWVEKVHADNPAWVHRRGGDH